MGNTPSEQIIWQAVLADIAEEEDDAFKPEKEKRQYRVAFARVM
jgi:hypothetical protein